ncbi:MAG: sulfur oxidation c-type cytochrome SoxX [Ideonella sp.]|nr:sulfur oxidation c-type cytochrome SoxX [Ideonella sp.]MCC7459093.1 sulfur oxidation c-type cytochrome SoxX [Nitrospira sp.]
MHSKHILIPAAIAAVVSVGCATTPSPAALDQQALQMIRGSFSDRGIAKADWLQQDATQRACSGEHAPPAAQAKQIEAEAMATIHWPANGQYIGDWRKGEKLAQNGRGMTWTDASTDPARNGAQCYNCHQLDQKELSFGTIGPSLYHYGKLRGVKDVADPAALPTLRYTWGKLWNSKATQACSNMPRFGHSHLLNEDQLRDLMALLLDPKSPVNQ